MAHRFTIQDLAEKAGVSVSTIDRILNGRDKVRSGTAERVLAAAEELQFYALPALRQRLKAQPDRLKLGFLLQQSHRGFYRTIASALTSAAEAHPEPLEVIVEHMDDLSPEAVSERILRLGSSVQALAVVCAEHPRVSAAIETIAARGVPRTERERLPLLHAGTRARVHLAGTDPDLRGQRHSARRDRAASKPPPRSYCTLRGRGWDARCH
jgi:LacI family transcriptional regulator